MAARLSPREGTVTWYANVEDLIHGQPLSSVAVLVLKTPSQPKGDLLVALGRMNLEYPAMQKVVVMEGPPPLPVASYLTACGVDIIWSGSGEENMENLATVVDRMRERRQWIAS